jgi:biotin carboxylase
MHQSEKPVAIVLGGTNPHIELIRQLKERGYYVVLVDYLANPPAREYADVHEQESTMDPEAVLEVAKKYNATLVLSACVDQANITACYVAEALGLTKPYSYKIASEITNKGYMKKVMTENGIPTTRYYYLDNGEELPSFDLRFPVMTKPADSCASSGVKKARNEEELRTFLAEARKTSRTGRTVVEEVANGVEVSAYCFVKDHDAHIIMVSERASVIEGDRQVLKCYATITPPGISDEAMRKVKKAADGIARAFGLNNTALHVQAICDGDEINIIEFAPRVGGGISYETIRENTGFDIISATIDSYLEVPVELNYHPITQYCSVNLIYGVPSYFDHLDGAEELIKEGVIDSFHYHKTKGTHINDNRASSGRIAAFVVHAEDKNKMCEKIAYAMEHMDAYDSEGNRIMRKDLFYRG